MTDPINPYGCAFCGVPKSLHGRRWHPEAEMHQWEKPTQQQIKDRMRARRDARTRP